MRSSFVTILKKKESYTVCMGHDILDKKMMEIKIYISQTKRKIMCKLAYRGAKKFVTMGNTIVWLLTWNLSNEMREFLLWANGVWSLAEWSVHSIVFGC